MKITGYRVLGELPDLFTFENGAPVKTKEDWEKRRKEIFKTAVELQYGKQPPAPEFFDTEFLNYGEVSQVKVISGPKNHPVSFTVWIFLPEGIDPRKEKPPFVIDGDLCWKYWFENNAVKTFTKKGIGVALFNRTELAPDIQGGERKGQLYEAYPTYDFGAIGAWAWGYSRCVDALEKIGILNKDYVAFTGHSRGGKATALAGALDERATIVNPNETCAGACGCYRIHMTAIAQDGKEYRSETLKDLMNNYGFWMGKGMYDYTEKEEELPFDTHFLKALVAPRIFFDSQASSDIWANPVGAWQTDMAAKEAYDFLGAPQNLYWYFREGFHYHKIQDMEMLANIILHEYKSEKLSSDFYNIPFEKPELIFKRKK